MKPIYSGKVRELYDILDEYLVVVTTDRISAFDNILPVMIKNKGVVLNTLSNFWFRNTRDIVANHIVDDDIENMPEFFRTEYFKDRTVMVEKLGILPFEFVVRGYMFGSMWKAYKSGESFCGNILSGDYKLAQKLERVIMTPAIKRDVGHDEYVDIEFVTEKLGAKLADMIIDICFKLYDRCSKYAYSKGLIIADAKFEFGINKQGELVLADEIFTPDSSRFWSAFDYEEGVSPKSYDKQLLRDWLMNNKADGEIQFDKIPENVLSQTEKIYGECLNMLIK